MLQDLANGVRMIVAGATITAAVGVGIVLGLGTILLLVGAVLAVIPVALTWSALELAHAMYWNEVE